MTTTEKLGRTCSGCGETIEWGGLRIERWRDNNGSANCPATGRFDHFPVSK